MVETEFLFTLTADLAPPEVIGPVPEGLRMNFYVTGGTVVGPKVNGIVNPVGGGDWLTVRRDGCGVLDVRASFTTNDGALIYMYYQGIIDFGANGYDELLAGRANFEGSKIRTAPRFQTAAPQYTWLNRVQAIGIGGPIPNAVKYDVHALR